jgi:pSer/pThr/pTyr-binding forkhead associated (FHA) protein
MPKLHILSPSTVARTIELTENLITIGRTNENAICIQDINVSKRHGILVRDGDDYQLHDFKSTNGTFVNGERIMAVKLQHEASIRLGSVELRYESIALAKPALSTPAATPLGIKTSEPLPAAGKERGMSKRVKPEFAGAKLGTGPVTLQPGFSGKPIPPPPPKDSEHSR